MDPSNPFQNLFGADNNPTVNDVVESTNVNVLDQSINDLIEHIFSITLNKSPQQNKQLIYMEDLAIANETTKLMNMELLEQALFERLLLPKPEDFLIPNNVQNDETSNIASDKVITYLYRSFERLHNWKSARLQTECNQIEQLILRNASTAIKQPDLFEGQSLPEQWLELLQNYQDAYECKCKFLSLVCADVLNDNDPIYKKSLEHIFNTVFDKCLRLIRVASLISIEKWIVPVLRAFVSDKTNPGLALLLLEYSTPKPRIDKIDGIKFSETLLGQLLCLSIMPKNQNGPYEYYENMADATSSTLTSSLWNYLKLHLDEMHSIFKGFLIIGGDVRNQMLEWIGKCLHTNVARGQIWNVHNAAAMMGSVKTVPDSFMIGLCGILLRLCKPLLRPTLKVLDVDATYFGVSDADRKQKSVHMYGVDKETCLISIDESQQRTTADNYSFVTEVFYMTHKAIDLGYRVCTEKFFQMNREVVRVQSAYQDAQAQGSASAQNLLQALMSVMPKFLCLQKLIIEPFNDQLLLQFYEATALWLAQAAAKITDPQNPEKEINANAIEVPLTTPPPKCLASIPEFIIENIVGYLTFIRHFDAQTIDTDTDAQSNIFTVILIFMGDLERARNPHLRARLAEGLESLLPKKSASGFGGNSKSLLFTQHPHRLQIVSNLLSVFVGIEVTGQSVQFEQKFNYRRPMYAIMEYLWNIDEQRECFKKLAQIAAEQMEAVNPPLFLRFINLLINDAIFLLDESLSNLQQIRTLQHAQDNGEWNSLPANEREQNLSNMQHLGMMARFDNILGRDTINLLKLLTSEVPELFCHPSMVDRVAAMLNYFLLHLVGPNKGNFKVTFLEFKKYYSQIYLDSL